MAAIIIPAHNESAVIGRTIEAVLAQVEADDEVIVVSNGSSDATAAVARGFGARVVVLESAVASKSAALNQGDRLARSFPRIYLDADVELAPGAVPAIKRALEEGGRLAVSPQPVMDYGGCSAAVKAYYCVWLSLPYCCSGMIGAGAYALSAEGRARFAEFPNVLADDGYVRALFEPHERGLAGGARSLVRAPGTLRWLLRIKTRSRLGEKQLAQRYPQLQRNAGKSYRRAFSLQLRDPRRWPAVGVYLYVNLLSRLLAVRQMRRMSTYRWERDLSSREGRSEGAA